MKNYTVQSSNKSCPNKLKKGSTNKVLQERKNNIQQVNVRREKQVHMSKNSKDNVAKVNILNKNNQNETSNNVHESVNNIVQNNVGSNKEEIIKQSCESKQDIKCDINQLNVDKENVQSKVSNQENSTSDSLQEPTNGNQDTTSHGKMENINAMILHIIEKLTPYVPPPRNDSEQSNALSSDIIQLIIQSNKVLKKFEEVIDRLDYLDKITQPPLDSQTS